MNPLFRYLYWFILLSSILLAVILSLAGLDGYVGKNSLLTAFDEIYSIVETYNIVTAKNAKDFLLSIIAGKGYIYGRFIYVVDAIVAFIPYKIFGLKGLIFAIRMSHALALLIGFHLLITQFIKNHIFQSLCLVALLVFPFTLYFLGMPKPEPFHVLLLALFLKYQDKNWSYLFLGFALGSKISIIFGLAYFALLEIKLVINKDQTLKNLLLKSIYFFSALLFTVPAILLALFNVHFKNGILQVINTTTKPYDDPSINMLDWLELMFTQFFALPKALHILLTTLLFSTFLFIFVKHPKYRKNLLFSLFLWLPIMLLTKRLWGHYLYVGFILILPILFHKLEIIKIPKNRLRYTLIAFIFVLLNLFPFSDLYLALVNRTSTEEFISTKQNTLTCVDYCKKIQKKKIAINIEAYYQFNWKISSMQPMSTEKINSINPGENLPEMDCYIEPINAMPKLENNPFSQDTIIGDFKVFY